MGAVQFIENLDRTALTVSDANFEKNVEAAVSVIAEKHKDSLSPANLPKRRSSSEAHSSDRASSDLDLPPTRHFSDLSVLEDGGEEKAGVAGLLRTIQRPLSSIGRIFSEELGGAATSDHLKVQQVTAYPPDTPRRLSPALFQPPRHSIDAESPIEEARTPRNLTAADAAARQASAEAAEALKIQRAEHKDVVEYVCSFDEDEV